MGCHMTSLSSTAPAYWHSQMIFLLYNPLLFPSSLTEALGMIKLLLSCSTKYVFYFWTLAAWSPASWLLCWVISLVVRPCRTVYTVATTGFHKWHADSNPDILQSLRICMHVCVLLFHFSNQNFRGAISPQISLPTRFWTFGHLQ